ncbi:MAG TPA: DUF2782 domain-containing protein [Oxalicibacterium sp.]|jgi:hypothetical protein|nr:DUF2782 domain-containing protein [Oxalicibacterium sp.]
MRTTTLCSLLSLSAVLLAAPAVHAQSSAPSGQDVAPPPPETQRLEEGEAPAVNIRPPDTSKKITETKSQGRVTEVKVQTGRSTYYAYPNDAPGTMHGDAQSETTRPVQFRVGEFGPPKAKPEAEEPVQTLPPNPHPAAGK